MAEKPAKWYKCTRCEREWIIGPIPEQLVGEPQKAICTKCQVAEEMMAKADLITQVPLAKEVIITKMKPAILSQVRRLPDSAGFFGTDFLEKLQPITVAWYEFWESGFSYSTKGVLLLIEGKLWRADGWNREAFNLIKDTFPQIYVN